MTTAGRHHGRHDDVRRTQGAHKIYLEDVQVATQVPQIGRAADPGAVEADIKRP